MNTRSIRYFIIYKPYLVLSQFSTPEKEVREGEPKKILKDFFNLPKDVYPVGRLDYDSEGLMILTNDTVLNHRLLNPRFAHEREYWVQVEGSISDEALHQLSSGTEITIDGKKCTTRKAKAERFDGTPMVANRNPAIRYRKNIPDTWIRLILTEGKNRQVRKMTASVGHPTLRLIRQRIEGIALTDLKPGDIKELDKEEIYSGLFSNKG
jgi:23S rRNA pseudouridine2457 synthase